MPPVKMATLVPARQVADRRRWALVEHGLLRHLDDQDFLGAVGLEQLEYHRRDYLEEQLL